MKKIWEAIKKFFCWLFPCLCDEEEVLTPATNLKAMHLQHIGD